MIFLGHIKIPRDKKLHFIAGLALALVISFAITPLVGFIAASACGVGKELYDMTGRGTPEWMDLWYTVAGGTVGAGFVYGTIRFYDLTMISLLY